jgi:hypothetical protein
MAASPAREQIHIRLSLDPETRALLERLAAIDERSLAHTALAGKGGPKRNLDRYDGRPRQSATGNRADYLPDLHQAPRRP